MFKRIRLFTLIAILLAATTAWAVTTGDRYNFEGPVTVSGDLTTSGSVTNSGTVTNSGAIIVPNETTTTTDTLTASQCGSTITLNNTTGYVTTLPTPTAGCEFKFNVKTQNTSGNHTVVTSSSANVIYGSLVVAGAVVACATEDTTSFVASTVVIGDGIVIYSDGTNWYLSGDGTATGGITCTQAS